MLLCCICRPSIFSLHCWLDLACTLATYMSIPVSVPSIVTHGELLIDFVPDKRGRLIDVENFRKVAGGAPANVAVSLAQLGESVAFIGQVGEDVFGQFLADTLRQKQVDVRGLRFHPTKRTALAFVSLAEDNGDRDFMFYRNPSADMVYTPQDVDLGLLRGCQHFHFGSISLIDNPSHQSTAQAATLYAIQQAQQVGATISYDPNLRKPLWQNEQAAREGILLGWPHAHIIKVGIEELAFLKDQEHVSTEEMERQWVDWAKSLWHDNLRALFVTRGDKGCYYMTPAFSGELAGFSVEVADTTGSGDAFMAAAIYGLRQHPQAYIDEKVMRQVCRMANANGAIVATRPGAIPSMPSLQELQAFVG